MIVLAVNFLGRGINELVAAQKIRQDGITLPPGRRDKPSTRRPIKMLHNNQTDLMPEGRSLTMEMLCRLSTQHLSVRWLCNDLGVDKTGLRRLVERVEKLGIRLVGNYSEKSGLVSLAIDKQHYKLAMSVGDEYAKRFPYPMSPLARHAGLEETIEDYPADIESHKSPYRKGGTRPRGGIGRGEGPIRRENKPL